MWGEKSNQFWKVTWDEKEKKKEHLRQPIVFHFRSEDISCVEKHYLPQNTKRLKGKKRQKGNIWKRWIVTFFFCWSKCFLFFRKKMYINGGVKKKRYQRWGEKCNNFFGNFFIILASTTNFVQNLNLLRPTKISLKTLFFTSKTICSFCWRSKIFFFFHKMMKASL